MESLVVLLSLIGLTVGNPVPYFHNCTNNINSHVIGHMYSLDATPPCDADRCRFRAGSNAGMVMRFSSTHEMAAIKPVAYALYIVSGQPTTVLDAPFGTAETNSCERIDVACPVPANTIVNYNTTVHVHESAQPQRLLAQWEMHDQADRIVLCFVVPVEIIA